jgi:hypothetical protein
MPCVPAESLTASEDSCVLTNAYPRLLSAIKGKPIIVEIIQQIKGNKPKKRTAALFDKERWFLAALFSAFCLL